MAALRSRLGKHALGAGREIRAVAAAAGGEPVEAVVVALIARQGWVVAATPRGLRLARCPRLLGRREVRFHDWRALTRVQSGPQRVVLEFGGEELDLAATGPHAEFVRLLEAARSRLPGEERPSVDELRELARRKLGRMMAFGFEAAIDGLPDRLEPGERVERLAGATGEFEGLLVLTDRRLLLLSVALRRSRDRVWAVDRGTLRGAEPIEDGLRVRLADGAIELTAFLPPDRRDEFAAVLGARSGTATGDAPPPPR